MEVKTRYIPYGMLECWKEECSEAFVRYTEPGPKSKLCSSWGDVAQGTYSPLVSGSWVSGIFEAWSSSTWVLVYSLHSMAVYKQLWGRRDLKKATIQIPSIPYRLHKNSKHPHFILVLSKWVPTTYFPFVLLALANLPFPFISVIGRSATCPCKGSSPFSLPFPALSSSSWRKKHKDKFRNLVVGKHPIDLCK